MLGAIRPDSWNFPLFLHVFGAMVLVGGLFASALALLRAPFLAGLGFRLLLLVTLPGYILMRVGAQWIASKEGFGGDDDPTWVGIGFLTSDAGALVLLVALILGGIGLRRAGVGLTRSAGVLAIVLLLAYAVSVWAMATKPD